MAASGAKRPDRGGGRGQTVAACCGAQANMQWRRALWQFHRTRRGGSSRKGRAGCVFLVGSAGAISVCSSETVERMTLGTWRGTRRTGRTKTALVVSLSASGARSRAVRLGRRLGPIT